MDTKEAIDVLIFSDNGIGHWRQNYRKIIKLLEEGEAYKQMWKEFDDEYIIVTYKIYGKEIEIIKFERKKKGE